MQPLVSIITPNYNKADFIQITIQSVLNQTYSNFELIIIDDGSTDDSVIKIESIEDDRIKLIKRKHESKNGGSICRNVGIKEAKGEFIIFLDSDDILEITCLENRCKELENYIDYDFLVFPIAAIHKSKNNILSVWNHFAGNPLTNFLSHSLPWHTMSPLWKTSFLKKIGGFDETFPRLQDVELHTRALLIPSVNYYTSNNKEPDSYYRIDEKRILSDYNTFISNWVLGTIKYINKFSSRVEKKQRSYLKGTLFSMINQINYLRSINKISLNFYKEQLDRLFKETPYNLSQFIKLYNYLYKIGFSNLKGYNWFFKKLYIHL